METIKNISKDEIKNAVNNYKQIQKYGLYFLNCMSIIKQKFLQDAYYNGKDTTILRKYYVKQMCNDFDNELEKIAEYFKEEGYYVYKCQDYTPYYKISISKLDNLVLDYNIPNEKFF